jgi:hypothetical protein
MRSGVQLVGDDLRQGGAQALPVRRSADAGFHESGGVHGKVDGLPARRHFHAARREGRSAVAGALGEGRDAEPEMPSGGTRLGLARPECRNVGCVDGCVHGLHIARLVEHEAGRGGVRKRPDQVAAADCDRIDRKRGGGLVHQPLHGKGDHRSRHAAIGRHRAGVGGDAAGAAGIFAHVIRAGQLGHGHQRLDAAGGGVAGIGTDIGDDIGFERD